MSRTPMIRRGLTLMELVVVMAILIALAAILVPLLPEFVGKANQSSAATNIPELEKAIQTFRATYARYPNHFDSMLTEGGTAISSMVPKGGGALEMRTLSAGQATRLAREGISSVLDMYDTVTEGETANTTGEFHATLNPYIVGGAERALFTNGSTGADAGPVVMLKHPYTDTTMRGVILNEEHDYAVFGIGKYCNLCGPDGLVKDAPVFGQHKSQNTPGDSYQRFLAVFDIGKPDTDTSKFNAKFVGCVATVGKRLFTASDLVGTYNDNRFDIAQPRK